MTNSLALYQGRDLRALLIPENAGKDRRSRLGAFADWLQETGRTWHTPDLAAYRDHLLTDHKASSTAAYLATVRGRYRDLLKEDATRAALFEQAAAVLAHQGQEDTPANRAALVGELEKRLENALDPARSAVVQENKQDKIDQEHGTRLTKEQASALIASPGLDSLIGLRDTAMLALALCTGIREQELCNLTVDDLRATADGELCLHVRRGKGAKTRAVFYGAGVWCLAIVDTWLEAAGIEAGPVFRGFYKGGRRLRAGKLTTRSVQKIVGSYPVMVGGRLARIKPHDLRRTYARRCYDEHMDIVAIQQNLGHADHATTLKYIGVLDSEARRPPALYSFNLADLDKVNVQAAMTVCSCSQSSLT